MRRFVALWSSAPAATVDPKAMRISALRISALTLLRLGPIGRSGRGLAGVLLAGLLAAVVAGATASGATAAAPGVVLVNTAAPHLSNVRAPGHPLGAGVRDMARPGARTGAYSRPTGSPPTTSCSPRCRQGTKVIVDVVDTPRWETGSKTSTPPGQPRGLRGLRRGTGPALGRAGRGV